MSASRSQRVVVTGATGVLGGAVARRLHATRPDVHVIALGRDVARGAALTSDGIDFVRVDLCDAQAVRTAIAGADAVVHAAALSSPWGPRAAFVAANIDATVNVVHACVDHGVRRLAHISTPGIYHDGRPHRGIREDHPLPVRAVNDYAATKRIAEQRALEVATNSDTSLLILRPRAIFGPGDTSLLPRIAEALRRRRLPRIGDGRCTVDLTYVDNAVDAVVHALDAPTSLHGRAYNVSNGEPVLIWDVIDRLAAALGAPAPRRRVPASVLHAFAGVLERVHRMAMPDREPALLRYGVDLLSVDMTLDISRARAELGYAPRVSIDEAPHRTFATLAGPRA
ncbi:NAD-dependent epimerase/dehydratase family protein [Cognatilysobacter terrigena]|uniref:NAD-dependent epimerase/dehydratase family protein n=1 Tax=Cognatilysobacter terrigena TaxID=2488749 RepID=UPI001060534D|nr:NAD-dependent epimerase/dehydratase family protein [Lysobacter terrigena]